MKQEPIKIDQVTRNRARCKKCGDIVESKTRHSYVECRCKSIAVDGGFDYLRRVGDLDSIEEMSEVREAWIQYDPVKGREVEVKRPV